MSEVDTENRMGATATQEKFTRLHVNLNRPTALTLKEVAARRDLTVTEAVRQAIGTWSWLDDAMRRGARIQLVEQDGQVREVMPMQ